MGVLPTKGLTLPLMSYGRSSLIVALAWVGLLLRVYHEAMRRAARLGHRAGGCVSRPVLIMAGGTGGHVFPALALARLLREQSTDVVWLGTERGLESRVIPAEGIPIERLSIGGLRGKGALTWLAAPFRLSRRALAGARASCAGTSRAWWSASAASSRARRGGRLAHAPAARHPRAERRRRLHQPLSRAPRARGARGLSRQLRPDVNARAIGNPGAPRHQRRARRRRRASPAARGADAHPRHRRQPGGGAPERGGALCAEASRGLTRLRRAPPGGRALARGRTRKLRAGRACAPTCAPSSRT